MVQINYKEIDMPAIMKIFKVKVNDLPKIIHFLQAI